MEMELRCSGAVDCLLALSFGFGEKCFVCKSLKLHIMASLAVSSSWPQTEPTDMHRATGQMGKRATGQPGNWASGQPGAHNRWPAMKTSNGQWRMAKRVESNWLRTGHDRSLIH